MSNRKKVECSCCGNVGWHCGHGWIQACYDRWKRAGRPAEGPPAPGYQLNWEEYTRFRDMFQMSVREAAINTGISERTAWRYEKRLKQGVTL